MYSLKVTSQGFSCVCVFTGMSDGAYTSVTSLLSSVQSAVLGAIACTPQK